MALQAPFDRLIRRRFFRLAARLLLGGIFVYASLDKIAHPAEFARIVVNFQVLPPGISAFLGYLLPWVEILAGAFLVLGLFVREMAFVLSSLLLVFLAAIVIRQARGIEGRCGCFTVGGSGSESAFVLIVRDVALLGAGITLLLAKARKPAIEK